MAILSVYQDNKNGSIDLLAIHNPLVFMVKLTDDEHPFPDYITATIGTDEYNCYQYQQLSVEEMVYIFFADIILRGLFNTPSDPSQTLNTLLNIPISQSVDIEFSAYYPSPITLNIKAAWVAKQYGQSPALSDLYNNVENNYMAYVGKDFYLYWYNDDAANDVDGSTYSQGFIRKKLNVSESTAYFVDGLGNYFVDGQSNKFVCYSQTLQRSVTIEGVVYNHTITLLPICPNDLYLKYMDRNGQYRFWKANQYYSKDSQNKSIGDYEAIVISIVNGSGWRNIGMNTTHTIKASTDMVEPWMLDLFEQLTASPDVQLEINSVWVQVGIKFNGVVRRSRQVAKKVEFEIQLPDINNITLL